MVELTILRDCIAIFGVIAGFSYYVLTVRATQRNQQQALETRQAQLFMPLYAKLNDKEFMKDFGTMLTWQWDSYEDFMNKYGPFTNLEAWSIVTACIDYYEGIGVLVKRNLIDISFIDDLMSGLIIMSWDKLSDYIYGWREVRNYPQFGEYFEYLYTEIKAIAEEQHPELKSGIIASED